MSNEQIYLYRRKGLSDYATCDRARYVELSQHKLFETMICYASADTGENEALRKDLESHKRMLLSAAVSIGSIGEALGAEMDDDPSELEGLAAELRKDAEFHQQVQRAAGELPHGWQILIRIEKDAGNAELIDPEGNEVDYPSNHEHLADSVSDAIDEALSAEKTE